MLVLRLFVSRQQLGYIAHEPQDRASDNFMSCHTWDRAGRPRLLSQPVTLYWHDPTSREWAATAGIEPGTSSPGVARSTDWFMLRRTEMSLFGLFFHESMLYNSTKFATSRFGRHLENLRTTTPLFNDIYFRSRVMLLLGGCTVFINLTPA